MVLPGNYKRVLASLAEIIDRTVTELIHMLDESEPAGGVIRRNDPFSPEEKKRKRAGLMELREENKRFFRELETEDVTYSEKQIYNAKITQLWTLLNDSRPERLKGFGTLGAEEKQWIGDEVERLLQILEDLK